MSRAVAILGGILSLAVLAGGLTEATLALGHHGRLSNDLLFRPAASPSSLPRASRTPTPTPVPSPTPTPSLTPVPTPVVTVPTAVTNSFVRLRAGKSTSTAILAELNGGTRVELLPDRDTQWQQVKVNGLTGYIFRSYLSY